MSHWHENDELWVPGWEKMRVQWIFVGGGERKEFTFEHRIFSGAELAELMRQASFIETQVYGGLDGRAYGREATRLVAVGRRKP